MIEIVKAEIKDMKVVVEWVNLLLTELGDDGSEFEGINADKVFQELKLNQARFNAFFAKNDESQIVGVVTVVETFAIYAGGNYGVIDEMYVSPHYRSQGVGAMMIETVKELGRLKNWARIDVTAPPEEKWRRTIRFYENQGFVFTGPKLRFKM